MRMFQHMSGVGRKDRIRNEYIGGALGWQILGTR